MYFSILMFIKTLHTNSLLYITTLCALNYIESNDLFKDGHFNSYVHLVSEGKTFDISETTRSCFEI